MAGRQLPIFSLIVPVWLIWVMAGWRATLAIWPALLVTGGSFALVQYLVSNFTGPGWSTSPAADLARLPGPVPARLAAARHLALPRRGAVSRRTRHVPAFEDHLGMGAVGAVDGVRVRLGLPQFKDAIKPSAVVVQVPACTRRLPASSRSWRKTGAREKAEYRVDALAATGTGIFLAAIASAIWLRLVCAARRGVFADVRQMRIPLFTIACMLAIAFTTPLQRDDRHSASRSRKTGWLYPMFAALLGWLGVALTGSDTSANPCSAVSRRSPRSNS